MMKLSSRKQVSPFLWIIGTEDVEVSLNLLVSSLHLSICLRVVCSGEFDIILEKVS